MNIRQKLREAVQRLNEIFDAERLRRRNRYLVSVKDAQRAELMRLREENLRLRELARIAPEADVPKQSEAPAWAWVKACDIQMAIPDDVTGTRTVYGFPACRLDDTDSEDQPCTCTKECGVGCKGQCGCNPCRRGYMDFLSGRDE